LLSCLALALQINYAERIAAVSRKLLVVIPARLYIRIL
jgi:hypothetical protein